VPGVFQAKVVEVEQESVYFLLFGRQLSRGGVTSEVWVEVRLPEGEAYPCLRDAYQSGLIASHVESKVAEALGQGLQPSAHAIALAGLSSLTHLVDKSVNCCSSPQGARAATSCTDCWFGGSSAEAEYASLLDGYGYLEYTGVAVAVEALETPYTGALKSGYEISLSRPGMQLSLTAETDAFLGGLPNPSALGRVDVYHYDESNCWQLDQFLQSGLARLDTTSLAYEENIIILAFGGELRVFYKFAVGADYGPGLETLKGGFPSGRQAVAIPAIVGWIIKKAAMAGTGALMHVGITVAFEKWFGEYDTWGEAWDNSSFKPWELYYAAASGALADQVVLQFFGDIANGMVSYVLNTPTSSFSWEGFFAGGVVTGLADGVLGLLTGGMLGDLSNKGKAIFQKYAPNINLTPGGPGGGDPWYRTLKELMGLVPTFMAKPKTFGAWKRWFAFPNLRKRADVLENYYPKRKKILLDVEESLGGHSISRHGPHLSLAEMRQRVLGTHPSLGQSRSALRFDNAALHKDAVDQAFNSRKADIEAHFNSGQTTNFEVEFNFGSQIGAGYTNTGTLSSPTALAVASNKVKLIFQADTSNPTGYKLLTAYPSYP
jgi:hypothetical protein